MASEKDIVEEAREVFKEASPRPWLVEIHDARGDYAKIALVTRNGYFQTGYYVIADDDMECRREQAIADFKAIARAPELLRALADEVERLRDLVVHMHVHSGYRNNGYMQMTTPQKSLYDAVWERSVKELDAEEASHPCQTNNK